MPQLEHKRYSISRGRVTVGSVVPLKRVTAHWHLRCNERKVFWPISVCMVWGGGARAVMVMVAARRWHATCHYVCNCQWFLVEQLFWNISWDRVAVEVNTRPQTWRLCYLCCFILHWQADVDGSGGGDLFRIAVLRPIRNGNVTSVHICPAVLLAWKCRPCTSKRQTERRWKEHENYQFD